MNLIVGNEYKNIECESFLDSETNRVRVRPVEGQGLPINLLIECSRDERNSHPIGTKFKTINVRVCKKPDGRIYLRAKDQFIKRIY